MLILISALYNLPLLSIRSGHAIGKITYPIIDPTQLKVIGFYAELYRDKRKYILLEDSIRQISNAGVIINNHEDLSEPDDLHRLQKLIQLDYELLQKDVYSGHKKIGQVADYTVDAQSLYIIKLLVNPNIWNRLLSDKFLIDRQQIIEVNDYFVLVHDNTIPKKSSVKLTKDPKENAANA